MSLSHKMPNFIDTQYQFTAFLRDPDNQPMPSDIEPRRMAIYQELFYNNIEGFIANGFPVLRQIFSDEAWHGMIRDFMIKHYCKAPLFHEIAREFMTYLEDERDNANDPVFIQELAHYEWVELALSILDVDNKKSTKLKPDFDSLTACFTLSPLAWLLNYNYPVHHIDSNFQPHEKSDSPTYLVAYRNQVDSITFLELNPVSARLINLLDEGLTGQVAGRQIADELQHPNPQFVINNARILIEDWLERGILITA